MKVISQSTRSKRARLESATYSLAEYAALMGVSYTAAHTEAQNGTSQIPFIKVGRQYRFPKATVDKLLGIASDHTGDPQDAA